MTQPTIEARLQKRVIVMSTDGIFMEEIRSLLPPGWNLEQITDIDQLGDWHELLLYRFLLLDLDEIEAFDPLDVIRQLRLQYQINLPVFCFGGDADIQDEMRLSRADRCFGRQQLLQILPQFFEQYNW